MCPANLIFVGAEGTRLRNCSLADFNRLPDKFWVAAGDVRHFDMSWLAFGHIARHEAGVIDVQYTRVPLDRCRTPDQGVNADTCNAYYGVFVSRDLWKLFVGVAVCVSVAAIACFVFVKSFYAFGS